MDVKMENTYQAILEVIGLAKGRIVDETIEELVRSKETHNKDTFSWTDLYLCEKIEILNLVGTVAGEKFNKPYSEIDHHDCLTEVIQKYEQKVKKSSDG